MNLSIFAIYDSKAEAFLPPFTAPNAKVAQRMFTQAAHEPTSNFHLHAEDYTLFELGNFDDGTGTISPHEANKSLCTAQSVQHSMHAVETTDRPSITRLQEGSN